MLRRTSPTRRVGIAVVALAAPLCAGLLTAGTAHAADDPVASAVAVLRDQIHHIYIDPSAPGQAVVNTAQTIQDIGTADIKLAVLPESALPAKETAPQLAASIGNQINDDKAVVIVIVGQKPGAAAGKLTGIPTGTADTVMIDAKTAHAGQFTLANVQATLDQAITTYVEELSANGSSQTVATPPSSNNNGKIWAILLVVVLVLLATVLVVRALVLRRNDKREEQHLPAARAEVEALYARLGADVTTLEPGDDEIARQAHTDASARYTAAGMELEEARSLDELAEARRATIEGLAASRVLRLRLGLEPGKDPASAMPAGPQVIGEQPVTLAGASYIGHAVYMPGSPFYFAGGWYQGAWVPGGWFSEPFWEAFDIPELVVGGFGGWGTAAEEPAPAAPEDAEMPPPATSEPYLSQPVVSDAPTTEVLAQPIAAEPSFAAPAAATPPEFATSATEELPAASGLWGSGALGDDQVGAGLFDTGAFETLSEPEPAAAAAPVAEPAVTPEPPSIAMPLPYQPLARPAGDDAAAHEELPPADALGWTPPAAEPAAEFPLTDVPPAPLSEPADFGWPAEPVASVAEPAPATEPPPFAEPPSHEAEPAASHEAGPAASYEPEPTAPAEVTAAAPASADPWEVPAAPAAEAAFEPVVLPEVHEPAGAEPEAVAPPEASALPPAAGAPIDVRPPLETPAPYMPISTFFADQGAPVAAAPEPAVETSAFDHPAEPVAPPVADVAPPPVEVPDSGLFAPVPLAETEAVAVAAPTEPTEPEPVPAAEPEPVSVAEEAPARAFGRGGDPIAPEPVAAQTPAAEPVAVAEPEPVAAQPEPAEVEPAAAAEPQAHPEPARERVAAANGWGGEDWDGGGEDWGSAWGGSDWTASESGSSSGGW